MKGPSIWTWKEDDGGFHSKGVVVVMDGGEVVGRLEELAW